MIESTRSVFVFLTLNLYDSESLVKYVGWNNFDERKMQQKGELYHREVISYQIIKKW